MLSVKALPGELGTNIEAGGGGPSIVMIKYTVNHFSNKLTMIFIAAMKQKTVITTMITINTTTTLTMNMCITWRCRDGL